MQYTKTLMAFIMSITLLAFSIIEKNIKGTIVNENNQPVPFAVIHEKDTKNAISADAEGKFSIDVESDKSILIISAVGYAQQEIKVGSKTKLNIILKTASQALDEIVVTGVFKLQKKVSTAKVERIAANPSVSIRGNTFNHVDVARKKDSNYNDNYNREGYDNIEENPFLKSKENPLSTFSIDVDGASYSNIRRIINDGQLPPAGAVRIEEMINYFSYNYPQPTDNTPFSINTEYAVCPWNEKHQLVSIGLQGKKIDTKNLPASNIVFLIDVSGSMSSPDKLPLVQSSMKLLADQLRPQDKVAMVVYAGSAGVVLPSTEGNETTKIKDAIDRLQSGGSTAGAAGIEMAYKIAQENFIKNGNNRIVLCTDGDFNVGQSSDDELERMIEEKRKTGIFLSVLGYGTGNYQDAKMQKLANKGNGNHAYIDNLSEARKVLINQFGGTMFTIAKDVKLQVEFNPAKVQGYRLIGYENRMLAKEDFNDDKKDAGELGSGHTVTALYEIIPVGVEAPELKNVDDLKYQKNIDIASGFTNDKEIMTVKFRYKKPDGNKSLLLQKVITGAAAPFNKASENLHLAAGLAQFGMLLRNSDYKGTGGYSLANNILEPLTKNSNDEYKYELLQLVKKASLANQKLDENVQNVKDDKKHELLSLIK